MPFQSRQPHIL